MVGFNDGPIVTLTKEGHYEGNIQDSMESFNFLFTKLYRPGGNILMALYDKESPEHYFVFVSHHQRKKRGNNLVISITSESQKTNEAVESRLIKKLGIELSPADKIKSEIAAEIGKRVFQLGIYNDIGFI